MTVETAVVYDRVCCDMARAGLTGVIGDPLPLNLDSETLAAINEDLESFRKRIRQCSYALAMESAQCGLRHGRAREMNLEWIYQKYCSILTADGKCLFVVRKNDYTCALAHYDGSVIATFATECYAMEEAERLAKLPPEKPATAPPRVESELERKAWELHLGRASTGASPSYESSFCMAQGWLDFRDKRRSAG